MPSISYKSPLFFSTPLERAAAEFPPVRGVLGYLKENYSGRSSVKVLAEIEEENGLQLKVDIYHRARVLKRRVATISLDRYDGKVTVRGTTSDITLLPQHRLDEIIEKSLPQCKPRR